LAATLALGQTPTSQQIGGLGEEAILPSPGWSKLGVCGKDGEAYCGRQADLEASCLGKRHQNPAARQNPQGSQPFDPSWQPYFEERAFRKKFGISRHQAGIQPS
jgi:hypothetical protein